MLGKTNIIYVAKNQNSEMQFVTETIITRSSSDIKNIKYLNGVFFAFTEEGSVLYGEDINNLSFLKVGDNLLIATDAEYFDGKYIFINSSGYVGTNNIYYCVSENLSTFENHEISCGVEKGIIYILNIVIDSYDRLVFLVCEKEARAGVSRYPTNYYICICTNPVDEDTFEIRKNVGGVQNTYEKNIKCTFMRDRFLFCTGTITDRQVDCITMDGVVEKVEANHYPIGIVDNMAYVSIDSNTYYSLNFKNYIKLGSYSITNCFMIGGQIGLYHEGTLKLASKVTDFTADKSKEIAITGIDYKVLCNVTTDEYTYLGCEGGIIIQCLLDVEGIYQIPEITLVKTLAAKQALARANEYTDKRIEELKTYVDSLT